MEQLAPANFVLNGENWSKNTWKNTWIRGSRKHFQPIWAGAFKTRGNEENVRKWAYNYSDCLFARFNDKFIGNLKTTTGHIIINISFS